MIQNIIEDLYLVIFKYLNVEDLINLRILSNFINSQCQFIYLLDISSKDIKKKIKKSITQPFSLLKIKNHNINNWYKLNKKNNLQQEISWRKRTPKWQTKKITRLYKYKYLYKIVSHNSKRYDINIDCQQLHLYCIKNIYKKTWNIYDNQNNLLAKIKINKYFIYVTRKNNKNWFKLEFSFKSRGPRKFKIFDFDSKLWENSEHLENNLVLNNYSNYEKQNNGYYSLKYKYLTPDTPSIKNCSVYHNDKSVYEFGKKGIDFIYCYRKPLHGLYAFVISVSQFLISPKYSYY